MKEFFEKDNKLNEFNKDVLFIDNNVDTLIDHFHEVEDKIPYSKFNKNGTIFNVKHCIKIINTLKENLKNKNFSETEEFGSKENAYFIINQAREDLCDKYEKELREVIEEALQFDEDGKHRSKSQKLDLIKNDPDYNWISVLYPAVHTDNKKILFMSIDKFLVRNSTIVEPSYNIINNKSLLNDSIIFIDEFDTSKDIILKSIINESLETKINIIELFRTIYSGLENTSFSKLLTAVSESLKNNIEKKKINFTLLMKLLKNLRSAQKK